MAMKIDTQTVRSTAAKISGQNQQLYDTLKASQSTIESLNGAWTGKAAEATISAYQNFARKYFDEYHEMLDKYVQFLNNAVGTGYEETENLVASKADQI